MKRKSLILGSLAVAMLVTAGCNKSQSTNEYSSSGGTTNSISDNANEMATNAWQNAKEGATNAWNGVREGSTNAWANFKESMQSLADYGYEKKDAFVNDASADVAVVDQKLQQLSDKVENSSGSVKAAAQAKLQDLKSKRAVVGQKLEDVKNATAANWNDAKTSFKNSYDDLKASLKQALE